MVYYPEFDMGGVKRLCTADDATIPLGLDVYVIRLERGETFCIADEKRESVILLLRGHVKLTADGDEYRCRRSHIPDSHHKRTLCVCASVGTDIIIDAKSTCEILVAQAENPNRFGVEICTELSRVYRFSEQRVIEIGELCPANGPDAVPCRQPQLLYYPNGGEEEPDGEILREGACLFTADGRGTDETTYSIRLLRR